jgi:hypothetical protein
MIVYQSGPEIDKGNSRELKTSDVSLQLLAEESLIQLKKMNLQLADMTDNLLDDSDAEAL